MRSVWIVEVLMVMWLRVLLAVAIVAVVGLVTGVLPMPLVWLLVSVALVGVTVASAVGVVRAARR